MQDHLPNHLQLAVKKIRKLESAAQVILARIIILQDNFKSESNTDVRFTKRQLILTDIIAGKKLNIHVTNQGIISNTICYCRNFCIGYEPVTDFFLSFFRIPNLC